MPGFLRLVLAAVLAVSAFAPSARADDLAERRALVAELIAIVPYSDADAERELVDGLVDVLRKAHGAGFTPYAETQAREATLEIWRRQPPISKVVETLLETRLTSTELREAIAFTRSPIAVKIRLSPARPGESQIEQFHRVLNADEQAELLRVIQQPGIRKYMTVLQEAAMPIGQAVGRDLKGALQARCATPKEPLPWC